MQGSVMGQNPLAGGMQGYGQPQIQNPYAQKPGGGGGSPYGPGGQVGQYMAYRQQQTASPMFGGGKPNPGQQGFLGAMGGIAGGLFGGKRNAIGTMFGQGGQYGLFGGQKGGGSSFLNQLQQQGWGRGPTNDYMGGGPGQPGQQNQMVNAGQQYLSGPQQQGVMAPNKMIDSMSGFQGGAMGHQGGAYRAFGG